MINIFIEIIWKIKENVLENNFIIFSSQQCEIISCNRILLFCVVLRGLKPSLMTIIFLKTMLKYYRRNNME